jgi:hypothetical protein
VRITTHEVGTESLDALSWIDALCVFVGEDERPLRGTAGYADWRLCGKLSRVLLEGFFRGERAESLLLPSDGRLAIPRIFAFGLGRSEEVSPQRLSEVLEHAGRTLTRAGIRSVATELPGLGLLPPPLSLSDEERVQLWIKAFAASFGGTAVAALTDRSVAKLLPEQLPSVAA